MGLGRLALVGTLSRTVELVRVVASVETWLIGVSVACCPVLLVSTLCSLSFLGSMVL